VDALAVAAPSSYVNQLLLARIATRAVNQVHEVDVVHHHFDRLLIPPGLFQESPVAFLGETPAEDATVVPDEVQPEQLAEAIRFSLQVCRGKS
jgi:hypothetical protein